jgi:hypothetical protein
LEGFKTCTRCKESKLLTDYYRGSKTKDGYKSRCKSCTEELRRLARPIKVKEVLTQITCPGCKETKPVDEFYTCKARPNGYNVYCKPCALDRGRKYKATEGAKQRKKEWYYSEEVTKSRKLWFQNYAGSEVIKRKNKAYQLKYPERIRARCALRRSNRRRATPVWFNAEKEGIEFVYRVAKELSERVGYLFHVDHIVPLKSDLVCGLHTLANLQLLPSTKNLIKGNKFWPDMP